jgi:hypothetical protein
LIRVGTPEPSSISKANGIAAVDAPNGTPVKKDISAALEALPKAINNKTANADLNLFMAPLRFLPVA